MKNRKFQKGSALFIVLIAVALFAALSFAVAQMMRGGNPNAIGEEKARLFADDILNYGRSLRQAAQNVKISNGCADLDVSVENTAITGYGHVPAARDGCQIFNGSGGGITYLAPSRDWLDMTLSPAPALRGQWYFPAKVCVSGTGSAPAVNCNTDGVDNEAVIAMLPYVRREVCVAINNALGISNPGGAPPQVSAAAWPATEDKYTGAQGDGETLSLSAQAGCFEGAGTPPANTYAFFQIMIPR